MNAFIPTRIFIIMPEQKSIDELFSDFKRDVESKGYKTQVANPESDLYKNGARFIYILPDELWMETRKTEIKTPTGTEPITKVFTKIKPDLVSHVKTFYDTARESAEKVGQKFTATAPVFAAGGVMVIYFGLK